MRDTNSPPWIDAEVKHFLRKKYPALKNFEPINLKIAGENYGHSVKPLGTWSEENIVNTLLK